MNIFKVFASAQKGFQEEYASAILAWLLNPMMEHGLGYAFLSQFIKDIATGVMVAYGKDEKLENELRILANKISPRLRSSGTYLPEFTCDLEYYVSNAHIDILLTLDDWIFIIENKIFGTSASDPGQLNREYDGLIEVMSNIENNNSNKTLSKDKKIGVIFIVPVEGNALHKGVINEYSNFKFTKDRNKDFKVTVTWQDFNSHPSIVKMIDRILKDEADCIIEPISEYTRHTMKALSRFICEGFKGYEYERPKGYSGNNPKTDELLTYNELVLKVSGFVGVRYGIVGLVRIMRENRGIIPPGQRFQFTANDMSKAPQWMEINTFKRIAQWKKSDSTPIDLITDKPKIDAGTIAYIAREYTDNFYVGVHRGIDGLKQIGPDDLRNKKWSIRTSPKKNKDNDEWISGKDYLDVYNDKLNGLVAQEA